MCLVALAVFACIAMRAGWIGRRTDKNEAGDRGDASWTGALAVPLTSSDALTMGGPQSLGSAMMLSAMALEAGAATGRSDPSPVTSRGHAPVTLDDMRSAMGQAGDCDRDKLTPAAKDADSMRGPRDDTGEEQRSQPAATELGSRNPLAAGAMTLDDL